MTAKTLGFWCQYILYIYNKDSENITESLHYIFCAMKEVLAKAGG